MPVVTKYICDGCGKEKGETNHWFRVSGDWSGEKYGIKVSKWNTDIGGFVMCGESCVLAAISKWMQAQKSQDTETGKG